MPAANARPSVPTVHKFGGSSLSDPAHCGVVLDIIRNRLKGPVLVVVSALAGVTDRLKDLAHQAAENGPWQNSLSDLKARHTATSDALVADKAARAALAAALDREWAGLEDIVRSLAILRSAPPETLSGVMGYGEVFSALILRAALSQGGDAWGFLDARDVLVSEPAASGAAVDWDESAALFNAWRGKEAADRIVVTGYVARTHAGQPTTLGRNGTDYSAAIFAALSGAQTLTIWKDVDGFMTANPKWVRDVSLIPAMTYDEARELAHFGAKILHPQTLIPAKKYGIRIDLKNTFDPDGAHTVINAQGDPGRPVKGVTTLDDLALIGVEGAGMMGVTGVSERFFGALRRAGVSALMISQSVSEQTINCAIRSADRAAAVAALEETFAAERQSGAIDAVTVRDQITALTVVGDGLTHAVGSAARMMTALARAGVNIRAIAQADSERSISVAIDTAQSRKALRAVHAGCLLSPLTVALGVIGCGNVGRALLRQLQASRERLKADYHVDLRLRAAANSKRMELSDKAMDPDGVLGRLAQSQAAIDLDAFSDHLVDIEFPYTVIVDMSGSDDVAARYAGWLKRGIHVVTCSKHAGSGPVERYRDVQQSAREAGALFRYEATVGAGLPVIQTLRDLIDTGDDITAVEGIFSGTLAYLFYGLAQGQKFSDLIRDAREKGYTEPDPRDDLSGLDVARKLVILTREAGRSLSLDDITIENLVPAALQAVSVDEFMKRLPEMDDAIEPKRAAAAAQGKVLRYTALMSGENNARPVVGLQSLGTNEPLALGNSTDNIIQFKTARYNANPLVVQGPGAGADVTAMGVFSDILRIVTGKGVL